VGRRDARSEFDRFVAGVAPDLLRTAQLVVWDVAAAEDLVQECLFRVARRWPRVRSMDFPAAYARRVLVNLALDDGARRERRRTELASSGQAELAERQDPGATRDLGAAETSPDLVRALGELTARQRATLVLRYYADLPEADVARVLGCSVGTVKSTASRALEHLRRSSSLSDAAGHADLQAVGPVRGARPDGDPTRD
jgi:RNA polymerase sigma-70 factor (sigma-E family)